MSVCLWRLQGGTCLNVNNCMCCVVLCTRLYNHVCMHTHSLLEMWSDDHTNNWCELDATVSTPVFSVNVTPCYMV